MVTRVPIACTLDEAAFRERKDGLLADLARRAVGRSETEAGFAFQYAAEDAPFDEITRVIDLERRCCPFLRFRLTVEPAAGPVSLELSGPAGSKAFLRGILGLDP
ncbi:MAG: hypothetical protein ACREM1_17325 [Longimicrobiales bacterium]